MVRQQAIQTVGADFIRDQMTDEGIEEIDEEAMSCDDHFEELELELWPRWKMMSLLNFLVKFMHLKVFHKWTNWPFNMLFRLLKISHREGNKVLDSHYDARRKLRAIGLGYESIHICKYDCALFWKKNALAEVCPVCKTSQ